jgi:hypothetical protein
MLAASDHKLIAFDLIVRRSNCTLAGGDRERRNHVANFLPTSVIEGGF